MKIAAIIAEYNPFHNGHKYQLEQVRTLTGADLILIMMSGDFVQRGGPACMDKYARCRMALAAGADIVCELPAYGASASAEIFAESAVALLNRLGCIDYLCFGCESAQTGYFHTIARILTDEPAEYKQFLQEALRTGINYPAARSHAICRYLKDDQCAALINQPNNILAIEYMKALKKTESSIIPVPIKRIGAGYHSQDAGEYYSSATAIRSSLAHSNAVSEQLSGLSVPHSTRVIIEDYIQRKGILTRNDFSQMIACRLLDPKINLMEYVDITEAIANRIDSHRNAFRAADQFIELLTTRNLTATRISRCLFHMLLGHTKEALTKWRSSDYGGYLRVLGFKRAAAPFFNEIPENIHRELITRTARSGNVLNDIGLHIFEADMYAAALYRQILQCKYQLQLPDIYSEPVIVIK